MNKITIIGRLAKEPEYKTLQSGSTFCKLVVVDNHKDRDGNEVPDYFSCKAFGKTADFIGKYFTKGQKIVVFGKEVTESWERDGAKHYQQTVMISEVEFAGDAGARTEEGGLFD